MPHPVPNASSTELPLTKHSIELGLGGGHKLFDMSRCPQRSQDKVLGAGGNKAGGDGEQLCRHLHVCVPESHALSQDPASLSALPHSIYQPCHSGMVFFSFFLFVFISPQMRIFPDLSNACSATGGEEGAFALSLHPHELCPGHPPRFIFLPTELVKINMFLFAYIQPACNLADREAPRGTAAAHIWICFRKMCLEKKPKSSTHMRGCRRSRVSFF